MLTLPEILESAEQQDRALTIEIERLTRKLWETRGQIAMLRSLIGQGATLGPPLSAPPPEVALSAPLSAPPNHGDQP
jgi:hypothetical protein